MPRVAIVLQRMKTVATGKNNCLEEQKCHVSVQVHWRDASAGLLVHTEVARGARHCIERKKSRTEGAIKVHILGYMGVCLITQFLFHLGIIRLLARYFALASVHRYK